MTEQTVTQYCECNSLACSRSMRIPISEVQDHYTKSGYVFISNSCIFGPEPTDVFIEQRQGYKVYKSQ